MGNAPYMPKRPAVEPDEPDDPEPEEPEEPEEALLPNVAFDFEPDEESELELESELEPDPEFEPAPSAEPELPVAALAEPPVVSDVPLAEPSDPDEEASASSFFTT